MASPPKNFSALQSLPSELLTDIMSRVGSYSRENLRDSMFTCKALFTSVKDPQIFQTPTLADVVRNPLYANNLFRNVFHKCLLHSNPSAHYVLGILEYFVRGNPLDGLRYLKKAADASVDEAIYLYGIINVARGNFDEDCQYMEQLNWRVNLDRSNNCWNNILGSLEYINIPRESNYFRSLSNIHPGLTCNVFEIDIVRSKCYYYKQLVKFMLKF